MHMVRSRQGGSACSWMGPEALERRALLSTWFVNADYSPAAGGASDGSFQRPFVKPQDAVTKAGAGDTISLRADTAAAHERIVVRKGGLTINSYRPDAVDPSRPVFNVGRAKVVAAASAVAALYITPVVEDPAGTAISPAQIVKDVTIRNLDLSGGYYALKIDGRGANLNDGKNVLIANSDMHHSQHGVIKVTPGANRITIAGSLIHDSDVSRSGNAEGIDAVNADDFIARGNQVWAISTTGIYVKGGSRNTLIEGNRVWNTGHGGILLGQDTDKRWFDSDNKRRYENLNGTVRNNIIRNTGAAGIGLWAAYQPKVYNNTLKDVAVSMQGGIYITGIHRTPTVSPTIYNNIVATANASRFAVQINASSLEGTLTADNNAYFQKNGTARFMIDGRRIVDFNGWKSTFKADANSSANVDPKLSADGWLTSGSTVAIDRGRIIADWVNPLDIQGDARSAAWDIGADEFTGST